jgi:prepilin-type N-terminal cleavage/methylation domain-containing protein
MPSHPRRSGFSLVEALVALSIAALVLGAIFELQIQMVRGQQRAMDVIEQVVAQENALALTHALNPMDTPEGEIILPEGDTIRWRSQPKGEPVINAGFPTGDGQFTVQLFQVTVEIERRDGRPPAPLSFDRMGWRQMGEPEPQG